ncbi:MAG: DEAD/DEAH box helicase [Nanoarchaeota archaeon]
MVGISSNNFNISSICYVSSIKSMDELKHINPREYQKAIVETAKENNTLVILPTGMGKTLIALMLSIDRIKKFPGKKILILAPTRPLVEQHLDSFKKQLPELFAGLDIFTGTVNSKKRREIWGSAEIIFSTPQCVDGSTLIFTEEGPTKISDFFKEFKFEKRTNGENSWEIAKISKMVLGHDGKKIRFLKATKAIKLFSEDMIKIKTEIGNTLCCTGDHPLLTISSKGKVFWKKASKLNKGDYIASAKKINIKPKQVDIVHIIAKNENIKIADKSLIAKLIKKLKENKIKTSIYSRYFYNFMPLGLFLQLAKKVSLDYENLIITDKYGKSDFVKIPYQLNQKVAYIIGAMMGDGHLGNRKNHGGEVVFSDLDRESVSNEFKEAIKEVFGVEMKRENKKGLVAYNSALSNVLMELGIPKGNKSRKIKIPKFLFFANNENICGFIKGIFDTDGSASKYGVSISSVNENFIGELKWLFLRIGILGNIEKRMNKGLINNRKLKESEIFTFRFSGRKNLQNFLEIAPNKEKCKKLIEALKNAKRPGTRSKEILPIVELLKEIHSRNKNINKSYKFSCFSIDNLKSLSKKLNKPDSLLLKELLKLPIRWVKIKEKEKINERKKVFDLTIENKHNFITNYLISHNCIANDVRKGLYNLEDVSLLVIDEAHRCLKNYDYTYVANAYKEQSINQRILGLTASPGSDKEKVTQICQNLDIEKLEIRTRDSIDVKPYLQERTFEKHEVPFPQEFIEPRVLLKRIYDSKIEQLRNRNLLFEPANKITLLKLQNRLASQVTPGNFNVMVGMSLCAQAIKISHALELLETQTLSGLNAYLQGLQKQADEKKSRGVQTIVNSMDFKAVITSLRKLAEKNIEHPKIETLKKLIEKEFSQNNNSKIMVFAQFRETASVIAKSLNTLNGINAKTFIGQAKKQQSGVSTGLSQKEQKSVIEQFKSGEVNIIVSTSIGEEGLDIPEVNAVYFYEPIPSEIRRIQRAGRTARLMKGKLAILITKDTRDEAHHYASIAREKKMHRTIDIVNKELSDKNQALDKFK